MAIFTQAAVSVDCGKPTVRLQDAAVGGEQTAVAQQQRTSAKPSVVTSRRLLIGTRTFAKTLRSFAFVYTVQYAYVRVQYISFKEKQMQI